MTVIAVSVAATVAFVAAFIYSGLIARTVGVVAVARGALAVIADGALSDRQKEQAVREASAQLFTGFAGVALRLTFVSLAPVAVMYVSEYLELASAKDVIGVMASWEFLLLSCAAAMAVYWRMR